MPAIRYDPEMEDGESDQPKLEPIKRKLPQKDKEIRLRKPRKRRKARKDDQQ